MQAWHPAIAICLETPFSLAKAQTNAKREAQGRDRPPGGPLRMEKRNESAKVRSFALRAFHRTILSPSIHADRPEVGPYLELRIRRQTAAISTLLNHTRAVEARKIDQNFTANILHAINEPSFSSEGFGCACVTLPCCPVGTKGR